MAVRSTIKRVVRGVVGPVVGVAGGTPLGFDFDNIVMFGDSIINRTFALGSRAVGFTAMDFTGTVNNEGVNGETTTAFKARIDTVISTYAGTNTLFYYQPSLNDVIQDRPWDASDSDIQDVIADMKIVLDAIKAAGFELWMGNITYATFSSSPTVPPESNGSDPFNTNLVIPNIKTYSPYSMKTTDEPWVNGYDLIVDHPELLDPDGLHFTETGAKYGWGEYVARQIAFAKLASSSEPAAGEVASLHGRTFVYDMIKFNTSETFDDMNTIQSRSSPVWKAIHADASGNRCLTPMIITVDSFSSQDNTGGRGNSGDTSISLDNDTLLTAGAVLSSGTCTIRVTNLHPGDLCTWTFTGSKNASDGTRIGEITVDGVTQELDSEANPPEKVSFDVIVPASGIIEAEIAIASGSTEVYINGFSLEFWNPLAAELSPALFLDATVASSISSTGDEVTEWRDLSGNNNHAVENTSSDRPTTGTGTISSQNAIEFTRTGTGDTLVLPSALYNIAASDNSTYIVFKSGDTNRQALIDASTTGGKFGIQYHFNATPQTAFLHQDSFSPVYMAENATEERSIVAMRADGTTLKTTNDDTDQSNSSKADSLTLTGLVLGNEIGDSDALAGLIGQVVMYRTALSDADHAKMVAYLEKKWPQEAAGAFTLDDLGAKLLADYDMTLGDPAGYDATSNNVGTIVDQSGNGYTANQSVTANMGVDNTRTINSLTALEMANATDHYDLASAIPRTDGYWFFGVVYLDAYGTAGPTTLFGRRGGSGAFGVRVDTNANGGTLEIIRSNEAVVLTGSQLATGQWHLIAAKATTGGCELYVGGGTADASNATDPAIDNDINALFTDSAISSPQNTWDGAMAQMVFCKGTLTTAEVNNVGNLLADKFNLSWTDIT